MDLERYKKLVKNNCGTQDPERFYYGDDNTSSLQQHHNGKII